MELIVNAKVRSILLQCNSTLVVDTKIRKRHLIYNYLQDATTTL
ncbi:hypothetical protein HMPREF0973_01200 [Prevotella veroralis F0319]|uniref:Uncharacterized protein n=1 Tax=Prevotella veroralis F0319 TaxID=649761 RepID=C9MNL3_9BACT|nr:hypothetical protein HMPREF0973_01200 [Prevotella veroralis F0319]